MCGNGDTAFMIESVSVKVTGTRGGVHIGYLLPRSSHINKSHAGGNTPCLTCQHVCTEGRKAWGYSFFDSERKFPSRSPSMNCASGPDNLHTDKGRVSVPYISQDLTAPVHFHLTAPYLYKMT